MGLFKPAWMRENPEKALKALEKETRQEKLAEIAEKAPLPDIRLKAITMLSDQDLLARLAAQCTKRSVFILILGKITGEEKRKELILSALNRSDVWLVDLEADVPKLLSPAAIANLALRMQSWRGKDMIKLIDDQQALAEIYKKISMQDDNDHREMRDFISKKLTDSRLMEDIIDDSSLDKWCRREIVWRLKDKEALIRIADTHPVEEIRITSALELGEPGRLVAIAKATTIEYVLRDVLSKLKGSEAFMEIALHQSEPFALTALAKITSVPVLRRILAQTTHKQVRAKVQEKLKGFTCVACGHDNTDDPARTELCVCAKCGCENHIYERRSAISEHRDYATGSRWDECVRCGAVKNRESVDAGFVE